MTNELKMMDSLNIKIPESTEIYDIGERETAIFPMRTVKINETHSLSRE